MKKKIMILCGTLLVASGLFFVGKVFATGFTGRTIGSSIKFTLIEGNDSVDEQQFILPTIEGNDGMIYVVRYLLDNTHLATVAPQSGEKIEGQEDYLWYLGEGSSNTNNNDAVILVADEATDSWWVIGSTGLMTN